MSFTHFMNDEVTLIKKNGELFRNIRALVQTNTILIDDVSIPIEEEDQIKRILPNGLKEKYLVIDRGYKGPIGSFKAHYQVKVEKETKVKKEVKNSTIYNVEGNNSRININSPDSSTNVIIDSINETNVFEKLRENIDLNCSKEEKQNLISQIDELERTKGTHEYTKVFKSFIQSAKDCMETINPFILALSTFFQN